MAKIHEVLSTMGDIPAGLIRKLDLRVFDSGFASQSGIDVSYYATANALGVVLPNNSPGVNSVWLPAIGLKIPVVLKPGDEEPWTPYRVIQALIAAGYPSKAISFYPTDHEGLDVIMNTCERAINFGDDQTCARYANDPTVQAHGTGRSKVLIGADQVNGWNKWIDVVVQSIVSNGGRSCINASCIVASAQTDRIAESLARTMALIQPSPHDDERAQLAGFTGPEIAEFIDDVIETGLAEGGAEDVTARYRNGPSRLTVGGMTFLQPTLVQCEAMDHPLANTEFLVPFASVVELPSEQMLSRIGPSLVVTAMTKDQDFIRQLLSSPLIDRLNLGPMATSKVDWSQPHQGNLFGFLNRRLAIQRAEEWGGMSNG